MSTLADGRRGAPKSKHKGPLAGLVYAEHRPCVELRPQVACYWTLSGDEAAAHRVLPGGSMDLVFNLSGLRDPIALLVGPMSAAVVAAAAPRADFLGVRFCPGEAFAFVRVSACEAKDQMLPVADVLGRLGEAIADEIASAPDTTSRVVVLDCRLVALRERARPHDQRVRDAVARILRSPAEARVAWLARDLGIGERQLERVFAERVGLGPKTFARVVRLQTLVRHLDGAGSTVPWAALALDLGYADQAHMVREVKHLSGITPTELARAISDSFNPPSGPLIPYVTETWLRPGRAEAR